MEIKEFQKKIEEKNIFELKAIGTSMHPTIKNGEILFLKKTSNFKKGDVLFYSLENRFFIHRLIKKTKNGFLVKGDMLPKFDALVKTEKILAVVEAIKKKEKIIKENKWKNYIFAILSQFNLFIFGWKIKKKFPIFFIKK
ncbi:MAG: S26 family signal peptidase [bacterium]